MIFYFFLKFVTKKSRCVLWARKYGPYIGTALCHVNNFFLLGAISSHRSLAWLENNRNL
jgi:hypothetical protein